MKNYLFRSVLTTGTIFILLFSLFSVGCHQEQLTNPQEEFNITPPFKLNSIRNPGARVLWKPGLTYSIKWSTTDNVEKIKIELLRKFKTTYTIAQSTDDDGTFNWTIPSSLDQSHHYRIKLADANNSEVSTFSVEFEIINQSEPPGGN